MIRVNVANNKILLLPPDIQEIMKEKAKYIISNDNYSNDRYEYIKKEIKDKGKKHVLLLILFSCDNFTYTLNL